MLPVEIASQTVTRLRGSGSSDTWNNSVTSWSSPAELVIPRCSVQPIPGDESILGRDSVTSRWNLWISDVTADVKANDRIRHDGVDYEIDGSVNKWTDTTGSGLDHLWCLLQKVEG